MQKHSKHFIHEMSRDKIVLLNVKKGNLII